MTTTQQTINRIAELKIKAHGLNCSPNEYIKRTQRKCFAIGCNNKATFILHQNWGKQSEETCCNEHLPGKKSHLLPKTEKKWYTIEEY